MRSADMLTVLRVMLVIVVIYLVVIKFDPLVSIIIFAIALAMDGFDGYAALHEASKGDVSFSRYVLYASGRLGASERDRIKAYKQKVSIEHPYGPRMDVAGDRIVEYSLWVAFTFMHIVPLFVVLLIVIRHSFADAFMGLRGTSSKLKTKFARMAYGSNASRAGINVLKFVTFSYLMLVYVWSYPIVYGYVLVALLVAYILTRGAAEIYESFAK
ncbi:MAG: CDP-alcohol phosphatidyltransferase family protein [Candidatus Micrarchaeaceae archaeon]